MWVDVRERRRGEWLARRGVRVDRVEDDGFGNPAFRLVHGDGSPILGLFVSRQFAEDWARSHRQTVLEDGRLAG
jgi:hypothetical protein